MLAIIDSQAGLKSTTLVADGFTGFVLQDLAGEIFGSILKKIVLSDFK